MSPRDRDDRTIRLSMPRTAVWALLVLGLAAPAGAADRRGGIEIGAKGVKAVVVEVDSGQGGVFSQTLMNQVSNTTVAAGTANGGLFSQQAIDDTATAAGEFAQEMKNKFQIPAEKIRVVGSSGLPNAANRSELVQAVAKTTGLAPMEFLTPCREVELTIQGLVPPAERDNALLIDVGSGNTKGGVIGSSGQAACFSVPLGSVTYATRVAKDTDGNAPFPAAADALQPSLLAKPLAEQVAANPELTARPTVVLSGGAPYALATLMHPEAVGDPRVTISDRDIADYAERLRSNPSVPKPDLSNVPESSRAAAEQEIQNVLDNFTRENLLAGSVILSSLSEAFKFPEKKVVFDRTGVTAWIRADVSTDPVKPNDLVATPTPVPSSTNRTTKPVYASPQSPVHDNPQIPTAPRY